MRWDDWTVIEGGFSLIIMLGWRGCSKREQSQIAAQIRLWYQMSASLQFLQDISNYRPYSSQAETEEEEG